MSEATEFSLIVRTLRKQRGLTQDDLATLTGRSIDAVSQWERGVSSPTLETVIRVANALEVPVRVFFEQGSDRRNDKRVQLEVEASLILGELSDTVLEVAVEQLKALAKRNAQLG